MKTDSRCLSVVLLLALMGSDLAAQPPDEAVTSLSVEPADELKSPEQVEKEAEAIAVIEGLGGRVLRNKRHVSFVSLSNTKVTDNDLVHLKELTLKKRFLLNLSNTKVTDAGLVHLEGLAKLSNLNLTDTQVGDVGLVHLKGLTNLRSLGLYNTKVTDGGLVHLNLHFPYGSSLKPIQARDVAIVTRCGRPVSNAW